MCINLICPGMGSQSEAQIKNAIHSLKIPKVTSSFTHSPTNIKKTASNTPIAESNSSHNNMVLNKHTETTGVAENQISLSRPLQLQATLPLPNLFHKKDGAATKQQSKSIGKRQPQGQPPIEFVKLNTRPRDLRSAHEIQDLIRASKQSNAGILNRNDIQLKPTERFSIPGNSITTTKQRSVKKSKLSTSKISKLRNEMCRNSVLAKRVVASAPPPQQIILPTPTNESSLRLNAESRALTSKTKTPLTKSSHSNLKNSLNATNQINDDNSQKLQNQILQKKIEEQQRKLAQLKNEAKGIKVNELDSNTKSIPIPQKMTNDRKPHVQSEEEDSVEEDDYDSDDSFIADDNEEEEGAIFHCTISSDSLYGQSEEYFQKNYSNVISELFPRRNRFLK